VRFGRWEEILAAAEPAEGLVYGRATWHWARGMALAAGGDPAGARAELAAVRQAASDPAMAEMVVGYNPAASVLAIAAGVLEGEILAREGDTAGSVARLREAAALEDALTYGEPPDWPVPVRHHLGAVLLQAGMPAEAEAAYREDLGRFAANGWSLFGLAEALRAQGKTAEAAEVQARLEAAWSGADVQLTGSRL